MGSEERLMRGGRREVVRDREMVHVLQLQYLWAQEVPNRISRSSSFFFDSRTHLERQPHPRPPIYSQQ